MIKFFTRLLLATMLLLVKTETQAQAVNPSTLQPFKAKGVGNKVATESFNAAARKAENGDYTEWNALVRVPFDTYAEDLRRNVSTGYEEISLKEARYFLTHTIIVARHIPAGTIIKGVKYDGTIGYYIIDHDFDAAVMTLPFREKATGDSVQIDFGIWECFNLKQVYKYVVHMPTCTSQIIYKDCPQGQKTVKEGDTYITNNYYYEERGQSQWYQTDYVPIIPQGYYMMPEYIGQQICPQYQPYYRCHYPSGQTACLYPVSQVSNQVTNYITINNTININISIITPTKDVPRPVPTPVGTNTGGGGDVVDNHNGAGGGDHPGGTNTTGGSGTTGDNSGGGGTGTNNTGAPGEYVAKTDDVPYNPNGNRGNTPKPNQQQWQPPKQWQQPQQEAGRNFGPKPGQQFQSNQPQQPGQWQPPKQWQQPQQEAARNFGPKQYGQGNNVTPPSSAQPRQPRMPGPTPHPQQNFQPTPRQNGTHYSPPPVQNSRGNSGANYAPRPGGRGGSFR